METRAMSQLILTFFRTLTFANIHIDDCANHFHVVLSAAKSGMQSIYISSES